MTVHMVRIRCERPPDVGLPSIRQAVEDWVAQHDEVLNAQRVTVNEQAQVGGFGTEPPLHLFGQFRFSLANSRSTLLDGVENVLQQYVGWYLVGYHGCDHDEAPTQNAGCQWNERREFGPVPSEVKL